jgi:hypothetical protein
MTRRKLHTEDLQTLGPGDLKPGTCTTLNYDLVGCDVMQVGIQELEFQRNMLPQTGAGKYRPREERPETMATG